jgi:hypothetical protein
MSEEEKKQIRKIELTNALQQYLQNLAASEPGFKFSLDIETTVEELTYQYYNIVNNTGIKSSVNEYINSAKIASLHELLIMIYLPLEVEGADEQVIREKNAELAFWIGLVFVLGMEKAVANGKELFECGSPAYNDAFLRIVEEHIQTLQLINPETSVLPVLFNSEFWKMLEFVHQLTNTAFFCP